MPPAPLYAVWPAVADYVSVADLYQTFARDPKLPKLLTQQTVLRSVEDAVRRGLLALRCPRPDGSVWWFWRSAIDVAEWEKTAEAWLPAKGELTRLASSAVLPESLPGVWPAAAATGVKLNALRASFDGVHEFEERYDDNNVELRPIPKAASQVVDAAVSDAIKERRLWLVFGNDSVFGSSPTALQLDGEATVYPPPETLAVADLLPPNLPGAWSQDAEPRSTPASLYAAVKAARGKPWPETLFLTTVNSAVGQGYFVRAEGSGPISSLEHDGGVALVIRQGKPVSVEPPPPIQPGRKFTSAVKLDVGEVQSLAEEISDLVSALAGMEPEIEVRVSIKSQSGQDGAAANKILERVKKGWTL